MTGRLAYTYISSGDNVDFAKDSLMNVSSPRPRLKVRKEEFVYGSSARGERAEIKEEGSRMG